MVAEMLQGVSRRVLIYGTVPVSSDGEKLDVGLFAVPAMMITFRETLEAAIIISVLLELLNKVGLPQFKKWVWIGVLAGFLLSLALCIGVLIALHVANDKLWSAEAEQVIDGAMSVIASVLIAVVCLSMGNIMAKTTKWERKLKEEIEGDGKSKDLISRKSIFFLTFTAVFREGLETIIFFVGIGGAYELKSLPIPAITGAIVGAIIGWGLYRLGNHVAIKLFFRFTMVILVFIGAGIFTNGMSSLFYAGKIGDPNKPFFFPLYDISGCCGEDNEFWLLMRVLFGYQSSPSAYVWTMYFGYQLVVWLIMLYKFENKRRSESGLPSLLQATFCGKKGNNATSDASSDTSGESSGVVNNARADSLEKESDPGLDTERESSGVENNETGQVARASSLEKEGET